MLRAECWATDDTRRGKVGGFQVGARETTVECPAGKE